MALRRNIAGFNRMGLLNTNTAEGASAALTPFSSPVAPLANNPVYTASAQSDSEAILAAASNADETNAGQTAGTSPNTVQIVETAPVAQAVSPVVLIGGGLLLLLAMSGKKKKKHKSVSGKKANNLLLVGAGVGVLWYLSTQNTQAPGTSVLTYTPPSVVQPPSPTQTALQLTQRNL